MHNENNELLPIDCMAVASDTPHAMANDAGDVFYPDNEDDALWFADQHDARPLNQSKFPFSFSLKSEREHDAPGL
jgi:hypothetical protein